MDWAGHPAGSVAFTVNGTPSTTVPTTGTEATASINMGLGFYASLTLGANKLSVVAVSGDGLSSEPLEQAVTIIPMPAFLLSGQSPLPFGWVGGSLPELQFKLSWPPAKHASGDLINIPYFQSVDCSFGLETEFTYKIPSGAWDFKLGGTSPEWHWGQWAPHLAAGVVGSGLASGRPRGLVRDQTAVD